MARPYEKLSLGGVSPYGDYDAYDGVVVERPTHVCEFAGSISDQVISKNEGNCCRPMRSGCPG